MGLRPRDFTAKALFFDMDSTVIGQESIVELARACGKSHEVSEITEKAMAGELDFEEALRQRVGVLENLPESIIDSALDNLTINAGMFDLSEACHKRKIPCFLISGGFEPLAGPIAKKLGFSGYKANNLAIKDGKLTGKLIGDLVDRKMKAIWVEATLDKFSIKAENAVAIGDGANDLDMMDLCGISIGYKPKPILYRHCDALIICDDHRFTIDFLF